MRVGYDLSIFWVFLVSFRCVLRHFEVLLDFLSVILSVVSGLSVCGADFCVYWVFIESFGWERDVSYPRRFVHKENDVSYTRRTMIRTLGKKIAMFRRWTTPSVYYMCR